MKNANTPNHSLGSPIVGMNDISSMNIEPVRQRFNPSRDITNWEAIEKSLSAVKRLYKLLTDGHSINRVNSSEFGLGGRSIHSLVSSLEKLYELPVSRDSANLPNHPGVKNYWFSGKVLYALDKPELLEEIKREFRQYMTRRKLDKANKQAVDYVLSLEKEQETLKNSPEHFDSVLKFQSVLSEVIKRHQGE